MGVSLCLSLTLSPVSGRVVDLYIWIEKDVHEKQIIEQKNDCIFVKNIHMNVHVYSEKVLKLCNKSR